MPIFNPFAIHRLASQATCPLFAAGNRRPGIGRPLAGYIGDAMRALLAVAWFCASPALAQITGVEGRVPPPDSADWIRVTGGYHIRVCRRGGACADDADRDVKSTYFVSIQPNPLGKIPADNATVFMLHLEIASGFRPPNACYASQADAGIFTVQPKHAEPDITLVLGGSVDAFYDVKGTIENGRIEGTGQFNGPSAVPSPVDTVVGVRTGPPDITPCITAAHALAIRRRHRS